MILLFTGVYHQLGGIISTQGNPLRWFDCFQYSLATFSTIGFADFAPTNDMAKLLSSIEAFLGISALAMLMFALGNRVNRS